MRVLLVAPYLPPEGGGLERYTGALAERLERRGHDVVLVGHAREDSDDQRGRGRRIGVRPLVRLSNTPIHPAFHRVVRRLLKEDRFDVVHAHTPVPGAAEMAWWAARREARPFVVTYHAGALLSGSPLYRIPARVHALTLERAMLQGAHARIAVSPFVSRQVSPRLPWRLAPPGVDVERFRETRASEPGRVLFVGPVSRAYTWKGFETLFEAMRLVARDVSDAHLRVVGDGDLRARYEKRAKEEGVPLEIAGRVSDGELADEYSAARVVVLPSLTAAESFGMTLAEANACGRPVVGSDVGGIPSFVRDGENGLLAPPGDARALADRIMRVLRDEELARRMGERGRAIVEAEHRWDGVADRTLDAYLIAACARDARGTRA